MAVKLTHRVNGSKISVADDEAAKFWLERGFVAESEPKPAAKKATTRKSTSSKTSK